MSVSVGQKASSSITLTSEHVKTYAEITGDYNPLHFDESFVANTRFKRLIVQGGLTTGLLHALVATDLSGPGTVFLNQNWEFPSPVYIGDTITAEAEVVEYNSRRSISKLKIQVTNQSGQSVLEGDALCYTESPSNA